MNTDWDVDMSGTGQVSGWGDDNFDIADMQEMKKNTTKKSKKKSRRLKQPLSPTSDPTAMLIKYAASRNVTESNGKSSSHVRPWSRSYDLIHRGAKLAEEQQNRRRNVIEDADRYRKYFKIDNNNDRQLTNIKQSYVFAGNAKDNNKNNNNNNNNNKLSHRSLALPIVSKYSNTSSNFVNFQNRHMSVVDGLHVRTPRFNLSVEAKSPKMSPRSRMNSSNSNNNSKSSSRESSSKSHRNNTNSNNNNRHSNQRRDKNNKDSKANNNGKKNNMNEDTDATKQKHGSKNNDNRDDEEKNEEETKEEREEYVKKDLLKDKNFTPPRQSPQVKHLMRKINTDARDRALSPPPATILVRVLSAGMHDGDTARIVCDDVDYSPNKRGFNVVTLDPKTLSLVDARAFNTHDNDAASSQMAKYLLKLPVGMIVLIAVRTDATAHVCGECVRALKVIGARSFRPGFGGSWAFCGVKGNSQTVQRSTSRFQGPATIVQTFTSVKNISNKIENGIIQSGGSLSIGHDPSCACKTCRNMLTVAVKNKHLASILSVSTMRNGNGMSKEGNVSNEHGLENKDNENATSFYQKIKARSIDTNNINTTETVKPPASPSNKDLNSLLNSNLESNGLDNVTEHVIGLPALNRKRKLGDNFKAVLSGSKIKSPSYKDKKTISSPSGMKNNKKNGKFDPFANTTFERAVDQLQPVRHQLGHVHVKQTNSLPVLNNYNNGSSNSYYNNNNNYNRNGDNKSKLFPSLNDNNNNNGNSDHILFIEEDEKKYKSIYASKNPNKNHRYSYNKNINNNINRRKNARSNWHQNNNNNNLPEMNEMKLAQTYAFDKMVEKHRYNHGYAPRMRNFQRPANQEVLQAAKASRKISYMML